MATNPVEQKTFRFQVDLFPIDPTLEQETFHTVAKVRYSSGARKFLFDSRFSAEALAQLEHFRFKNGYASNR